MRRSRYRRRIRGLTSEAKRRLLLARANSRFQRANRELRFEPLEHRHLLAADITTGLAGHWQLEENAIGQTVVDSSGFGNDGQHVNLSTPDGPSTNAALGSYSLSTDGVDDYVSIPADPSLDLSGGQFTQSVWIFPEPGNDDFHGVLGYQGSGGNGQRYPGIWVQSGDRIHAGFGYGSWRGFSTPSVLTLSAWNHVVTTFDSTYYRVYVDGVQVRSTTALANRTPYPTQQVDIGRINDHFDGLIDDVRIYNRALTQEDVTALFDDADIDSTPPTGTLQNIAQGPTIDFTVLYTDNQAIDVSTLDNSDLRVTGPSGFDQLATFVSVDDNTDGTPRTAVYRITAPTVDGIYSVDLQAGQVSDTTNNFVLAGQLTTFPIGELDLTALVGHWKLEETAIGQTVVDASGQGNDGVHVNFAAPDGPNANAIRGSYSLSTDGVDDHVSIPADPSLDLSGGQFTQSVWIFPEPGNNDFHGVLGYQGDGGNGQRYPGIWVQSGDRIHAGFGYGSWRGFSTPSVLTLSAWNHVVTTFDGTHYRVYVDGVQVRSSTALANRTPYPTQQVDIGRINDHFDGLIDDVRIYARSLDASEVELLFNISSASPGSISLQTNDITVSETDGVVSIPVVRNGGSEGTVTVDYATSDDTAASPTDFTAVAGTLTFLDGETIQTIDIPIVDDSFGEGDEVFDLSLSSVTGGASLGTPNAGTITIVDDEELELTVAIAAASIGEGDGPAATTATVTRNDEDISASLDVTLVSDDPTEATVPVTVTIPAEQSSVTFDIDAIDDAFVDGTQTVIVTASTPGYIDGTDSLDVSDDELPTLTVTIAAASIGENDGLAATTATVSRNDEDVSAALDVTLASDDASEATVPLTVTIPADQTSVTFDIDAVDDGVVDGRQLVTITASAGGYIDGTDTVDVTDDDVLALAVTIVADSIGEAAGLAATTATVTRNDDDLSSPLDVTLVSDDATEATVPLTVTIPANQASVVFDIDAVDDVIVDGTQTVTITTSATGYVDGTDTLDVSDDELPTLTVTIAAASVGEGDGPAAITATVSRNDEDISAALDVTLASDDPTEATVPVTITIPADQTSVTFDIDAIDDAFADGTQTVIVTASVTGYIDGNDTLDVSDDEVPTLTVTIAAASVGEGDGPAATTATVSRNDEDISAAFDVVLASDDPSEATVPLTITIPPDLTSVTFDITAIDDAFADGAQTVIVTASATGYVEGTDSLDVSDDELPTLTVTIAAASVGEGDGLVATTATVSRNDEDISAVLDVTLVSDDPTEAAVPVTIAIPADQASVTFDIDAIDDDLIDGTQSVTITASAGGYIDGTDTVDVTDDDVLALTVTIVADSISEAAGLAATAATVTRNDDDLSSTLDVTLVSDDATEATVPLTVTIPADQASVVFDIDAVDDVIVDGTQTVTIAASATGYVDGADTLDVSDDEVPTLTVTIAAASVGEGDGPAATTATVTRDDEDISAALDVTLVSDDPTEAAVPVTITIPADQASVTFDIDAIDDDFVDGTQSVTITASAGGYIDGTDTVDVTDDDVLALTVTIVADSIGEAAGLAATTATVTRNDDDLSSSLDVTLVSDDATEATVPLTVTIPADQTSVTFDIDAIDDAIADGTQTVIVTASATGYVEGTDSLDVSDDEVPTLTVTIAAASVGEGDGPAATTATVTRDDEDISAALDVTLVSDDPTEAAVPVTITIPADQASVTFDIDAIDDDLVDGTQSVTITASAGGYIDGTDTFDVTDDDVLALTVTIVADSISEAAGLAATTATVTRNDDDLSSSLDVTLVSDDATEATVPLTVTIPADQASVVFDIDAVDDVIVDGTQTVTITASATGYVDGTDTLDVSDDEVPTLTMSIAAASIGEGDGPAATTATVSRNDEDVSAALDVTLASDDSTEAAVPVTVTIPADQTSVTFAVDAIDDGFADGTQIVTVTASATGYVDGTDSLDVSDDELPTLTVTIAAASIGEGDGPAATTATVSRNDEDISAALDVTLVSDDPTEATVPVTVTIPADQSSVTFDVDAIDDAFADGTQIVTVTASATGYVDGTDTLDVSDDELPTLTVAIAAASVGEGDGPVATTATVSRNDEDISAALDVTLASDDPTEATVPVTITIPADQTSVTFAVDAIDDAFADGTQIVTVTASATGYVDGTDTLDVSDDDVASDPTLVGHWQLEETVIGQTVVDSSGNGNDGQHVNISTPDGPSTNAALGSYSLSTDGVDDHVSIPPDPSLDLSGGQFTQSVWIHPEAGNNDFHGVLGYQGSGGNGQRYPGIWVQTGDRLHAGFGDGTWKGFSTPSVLTLSAWNHVVTTFDGTDYKVYVDGVEVRSTTALAGRTPYPTQQVDIGRINDYFDGLIDDVRIYNRTLTQEDVTALFNGTGGGDSVPPTANVQSIAQGPTVDITVLYTDNQAVDVSTLDNSDLRVTGPAGFDQLATLLSVDDNTDGTPRTAVYSITAPTIDGTYFVELEVNQVVDTSGNFAVAGQLATFQIGDDPGEPDPTALVGHWKLEETAIGQTVLDTSGLGNNGVHVNLSAPDGPSTTAAVGNSSLSTDGVDDYVGIPADPSLDLSGGQFTQSVWIFPEPGDTEFHGILGHEGTGGGNGQRYPGIWVQDQDKLHAGFGDGTWGGFSTGSVLTLSQWNHVVTTFDGTNYKVFVNGEEVRSTTALAGRTPFPTQQVDIGRVGNYFDGLIDDVRIYARTLDAFEVQLLTSLGAPDNGNIQMADNSYTVNEPDGVVSIEVIRVGGSEGTVTVDYTSVDGSAVSPLDYTGSSGAVTFLDGQTSAFINIPIIDDSVGEVIEAFSVSLDAPGGGAVLGFPRTRLITIVDDDPPSTSGTGLRGEYYNNIDLTNLALIRTDGVVAFDWATGSPDPSIGANTFSVRWTGQVEPLYTETYSFHATTNDGVRLWVDGQQIIDRWVDQSATRATGTIDLVAGNRYDIVMEFYDNFGDASALLEWSSATQALAIIPQSQLYDGSQSGAIISFAANITDVDESAGTAQVTVLRLGDTSGTSTVEYATSENTATAGSDYTDVSGVLNFAVDETSKTISIPITDDSDLESTETIDITLSNPTGAILGTQSFSQARILDDDPGNFIQETFIDNLFLPTTFEWAPDGRMFVVQKRGQVFVYDSNGVFQNTFIDIAPEVNHNADRGLLGFTLHPDFPTTPYAYLLYAYDPPEAQFGTGKAKRDQGGNRVNRMIRVTADAATNYSTAVPGSEVVILGTNSTWENISSPDQDSTGDPSIPPSCAPDGTLRDCLPLDSLSHAVGTVKFAPDGSALFVSVGDGTSYGIVDPRSVRVQDLDSLSGKILRLDPITGEGLSDNPFFDGDPGSNRSKIYSYGLRNPFRFTVHPVTGEPFIGDVGWTAWEEINTGGGVNFGWPYFEGGSSDSLQTNGYKELDEAQAFYATGEPVQEAIYARPHTDGATALIMGDFYTGTVFPSVYQGALFFADVNEGSIDFITFDAQGDPEPVRTFANGVTRIVHMATGPDGYLYFTNILGRIERFRPGGSNPPGGSGESGAGGPGASAGRPFLVVDSQDDLAYGYESFVEPPRTFPLSTQDSTVEGVTANPVLGRVWTVDAAGGVDFYDGTGSRLGEWNAADLGSASGIATDGVGIWIVDNEADKIFHYAGGVSLAPGTHSATTSFDLDVGNQSASGITTNGLFLWVTDADSDQVFKYTMSGFFVGSWSLDAENADAQGITSDVNGYSTTLWVVDETAGRVFSYADGANYVAGAHDANSSYPLAQESGSARGIADASQFDINNITTPSPLQNKRLRQDVNNDQEVSAMDALIIINWMGRAANFNDENQAFTGGSVSEYFTDVNGDREVTALDALQVINFLARERTGGLVGESEAIGRIDTSDPNDSSADATDYALADLSGRSAAKVTSTSLPPREANLPGIALAKSDGTPDDDENVLDLLADDLLTQQSLRSDLESDGLGGDR